LSPWVNGELVATYTVTPDCIAPKPVPKVSIAGQVCPPPTSTVTLSNVGDPDSAVVFVIQRFLSPTDGEEFIWKRLCFVSD
jgi:hypothetical protein